MTVFLPKKTQQEAPTNRDGIQVYNDPLASPIRQNSVKTHVAASHALGGPSQSKLAHLSQKLFPAGGSSLLKTLPSSGPPTSRYSFHDSRREPGNGASMKGAVRAMRQAEQMLSSGSESGSRMQKLPLATSSASSHRLISPSHAPTSLKQTREQMLSASKPLTPPLDNHVPPASPPEDGWHDILPPNAAKSNHPKFCEEMSAGHTGAAGSKMDVSSQSSTVQGLSPLINPKSSQMSRRISSTPSSAVSSLTPTSTLYPSLSSESVYIRQCPANLPSLTTKSSRKSSPQDRRQTTLRALHKSTPAHGVGYSDRGCDDAHDSARLTSAVAQVPGSLVELKAIRNKFASSNGLGTGGADLSSDSSESSTSSSTSSVSSISYPVKPSTSFLIPIAPSARNQQPLLSDSFNPNLLSTSPTLQHRQVTSELRPIKLSPSLANMSAVNTSSNDACTTLPQLTTQSESLSPKMMPQFSNFYYPPQMMHGNGANPFVFSATVDASGRPLTVDVSVMQRNMLNPHCLPSGSSCHPLPKTSAPPSSFTFGNPIPRNALPTSRRSPSGKFDRPTTTTSARRSTDAIKSRSKTNTISSQHVSGLRTEAKRQRHVVEVKPSSHIPHNNRHDITAGVHPTAAFHDIGPILHSSTPSARVDRHTSSAEQYRRRSSGSRVSHASYPCSPSKSSLRYAQPQAVNVNVTNGKGNIADSSQAVVEIIQNDQCEIAAVSANSTGVEGKDSFSLDEVRSVTPPPSPLGDPDYISSAIEEPKSPGCHSSAPFPFALFLSVPELIASLLPYVSFHDWCMIFSVSKTIRLMISQNELLKEEALERFLKHAGYSRWTWREPEPLSLSLMDLHDYMRGVSVPLDRYTQVAERYLQQRKIRSPSKRDADVLESAILLRDATRAYNRVLLRLRAQAEKDPSLFMTMVGSGDNGNARTHRASSPTESSLGRSQDHSSSAFTNSEAPMFRLRRAPLLRVFIPSPEGDWLSDSSVLQCEEELKLAGLLNLLRIGDCVWDIACGDNANFGRMIWDGSYLVDLDYTYSALGDVPKYIPALAFPPSYFHRVIRTSSSSCNPVVRIDISPWGEEVAANLQLLQNKGRIETPPGSHHSANWVHRSSFWIKAPLSHSSSQGHSSTRSGQLDNSGRIPIPGFTSLFVDPSWYGKIIIEAEGTGDSLMDLQDRCGPGAFPPRVKSSAHSFTSEKSLVRQKDARNVFIILREKSRPGEIWIRAVNSKEGRL